MDTLVRADGDVRTHISNLTEPETIAALALIANSPEPAVDPDRHALQAFLADLSYSRPVEDVVADHANRWALTHGLPGPAPVAAALQQLLTGLAKYAITATRAAGLGQANAVPVTTTRQRTMPGPTVAARRAGDTLDDHAIRLFADKSLPLVTPKATDDTLSWAAGVLLPLPDRAALLHRYLVRVGTSTLPDVTVDSLWRTAAICGAGRPGALVTVCMLTDRPAVGTALVHHTAMALLDHHRTAGATAIRNLVATWARRDATLTALRNAAQVVTVDAAPLGDAHVARLADRLPIIDRVTDPDRAEALLRNAIRDFTTQVVADEKAAKATPSLGSPRWLPDTVGQLTSGQVATIGRLHGLTVDTKTDRTTERAVARRLAKVTGPQLRDAWRPHVTIAVRHDLVDELDAACRRLTDDPMGWDRDFVAAHRDRIRALRP